ncbi:MAG: hypothetical protein Q8O97_01305 [bacterium]|nr:hypothetical protein [bacterium]
MVATEKEEQSLYRSIVKMIRDAKSDVELCIVAKALRVMAIPLADRRAILNIFNQRVTNLGLSRDVPEDIEHARTVLSGEASAPETPSKVP